MPSLLEVQKRMHRAVVHGDFDGLEELVEGGGLPVRARLAIHQNNYTILLTEALATTFPVVFQLVGEAFFSTCARAFMKAHPPETAVMLDYGHRFPGFLSEFPPAQSLVYLGDVAGLEWMVHECLIAADAGCLDGQAFLNLAATDLLSIAFHLHPALRLFASSYPVGRIWQSNMQAEESDEMVNLNDGPEYLLIYQSEGGVVMVPVSDADHAFISALVGGANIQMAAEAALALDTEFSPQTSLSFVIGKELVTEIFSKP